MVFNWKRSDMVGKLERLEDRPICILVSGAVLLLSVLSLSLGCGVSSSHQPAADVPKVVKPVDFRKEARLVSEPEFSGQPGYAVLLHLIKPETTCWLMVDDRAVFVDRNADGQFAEDEVLPRGERGAVIALGQIGTAECELHLRPPKGLDGEERDWAALDDSIAQRLADGWMLWTLRRVDNGDPADFPIWISPTRGQAVATHVNGPLEIRLKSADIQIGRTEPLKFDIRVGVGDYQSGGGYRGCAAILTESFAGNPDPVATFRYKRKGGGKPVEQRVKLTRRC